MEDNTSDKLKSVGFTSKPQVPKDLGRDGKKYWRLYFPLLLEQGRMTPVDIPLFHQLCSQYEAWLRLKLELDNYYEEHGKYTTTMVTKKGDNYEQVNPLFTMEQHARKTLEGLQIKFLMTPSDRQKVLKEKEINEIKRQRKRVSLDADAD